MRDPRPVVPRPGAAAPGPNSPRQLPGATLVLRVVGTTVYPYACDEQVVSIFDARYMAVYTPRAFAAIARYVLKLQRDIDAQWVIVAIVPHRARRLTPLLVEPIASALQRAGVAVAITWTDPSPSQTSLRIVDRRLAWDLVNILSSRRADRAA